MCNLVDELKKDFIVYQMDCQGLTKEEAEVKFNSVADVYLDDVFEAIANILQDLE